jgi:hypothetical protein
VEGNFYPQALEKGDRSERALMLAWFAATQCQLPDHTFLKPNPVHALALVQMCKGETAPKALRSAYDLWRGKGKREGWVGNLKR